MLLTEVFYFALFTISVTAYTDDDQLTRDVIGIRKNIIKRDASIIMDNFPIEITEIKKPKVIYRRISKQRFRVPKPEYTSTKPKYNIAKKPQTKKPYKKYKVKKVNQKFTQAPNKRVRPSKPRRRPPATTRPKPKYNRNKHITPSGYFADPTGFGEPPITVVSKDFTKPPSLYAEPPVDSYGTPLRTSENYPTKLEEYVDATDSYDKLTPGPSKHYHRWHEIPQVLSDEDDFNDLNINNYADVYKYKYNNKNKKVSTKNFHEKYKNPNGDFIQISQKYLNKPWKVSQMKDEDIDEQIIVGGQYAEPPGRVISKDNSDDPHMYFDETGLLSGYAHPEIPSSAGISPYVNYKHSNMAFSPQNLNDAFGIIEQ